MPPKKTKGISPTRKAQLMCKCVYESKEQPCAHCVRHKRPCGRKWTRQEAFSANGAFDEAILYDQVTTAIDFIWKFIKTQYPSLSDFDLRGLVEDALDRKVSLETVKEEPSFEMSESMTEIEQPGERKEEPVQETQRPLIPLSPPHEFAASQASPNHSVDDESGFGSLFPPLAEGGVNPNPSFFTDSFRIDEVSDDVKNRYGDLVRQNYFSLPYEM
jgi:hypothetical protein